MGEKVIANESTIFWTRCLPGPTRTVWVYGRNLWTGPEKVSAVAKGQLTAGANSYTLGFNHYHGANDQDGNRALPYLQRFTIPGEVPSGSYELYHTRNDGAVVSCRVEIPEFDWGENFPLSPLIRNGVKSIDEPYPVNWHEDFNGLTLMPTNDFPVGKPLVILKSGARIRNLFVYVPEGSPPSMGIAVESPSKGVRLTNVNVRVEDKGKIGIQLRGAEDAFFHCVDVVSSRCVDANPSDCPKRNTFVRCSFTSPRGSADGQVGRGTGGEEAFMLQCGWSNIDRGPTLSPQGAPLSRCVWFECSQRNTGITEGASEGLLIEAKKLCPVRATIIGQGAVIKIDDAYLSAAKDYLKPGYSLWTNDGTQRWARICECNDPIVQGQAVRVKIDRVFSSSNISEVPAYVGNGLTESAILRCRFSQGRSGVWFWCANADCVVVGNECTDLDFGFLTLQRSNPPSDVAFSWGLVNKHNRYRRVGEEWKVMR